MNYVTLEELKGRLYHFAAQTNRPVVIRQEGNFSQVGFSYEHAGVRELYKLFKIYTGSGKYNQIRDMIAQVVDFLGGELEEWNQQNY